MKLGRFDTPVNVLLVEDNPGDRDLLREQLERLNWIGGIVCVATLEEALDIVRTESIDVILLDLDLPDSQGIETFHRFHTDAPHLPVVVMTGLQDEAKAIAALQGGAQDYLEKARTGRESLGRSVRYATERSRLLSQLEIERRNRDRDRSAMTLIGLKGQANLTVTERMYGGKPLKQYAEEVFQNLVRAYTEILENSLENQVTRAGHDVSNRIRTLAESLGFLAAGPRDVVDINMAGLSSIVPANNPEKADAYAREGQFIILELMGHLVSFYRCYFPGANAWPTDNDLGASENSKREDAK